MSVSAVSAIALSGMQAASVRQIAATNNVANMLTSPIQRLDVSQRALPSGGVQASVARTPVPEPRQGTDLVADMVDQMGALYALKANVVSLRVADRMTGTVINLLR